MHLQVRHCVRIGALGGGGGVRRGRGHNLQRACRRGVGGERPIASIAGAILIGAVGPATSFAELHKKPMQNEKGNNKKNAKECKKSENFYLKKIFFFSFFFFFFCTFELSFALQPHSF